MEPVLKCSECQTTFSAKSNLTKHSKKFHPAEYNKAPKKIFKYHCEFCRRRFNQHSKLLCHKRTNHKDLVNPDAFRKKINRKCPLCKATVFTNKHFIESHNIHIESIQLQFATLEGFKAWKNTAEKKTKTFFVKACGNYSRNSVEVIYYNCHRSGHFVKKGKGVLQVKHFKSVKINGYCPAHVRVALKDGVYCVDFVHTHIGHEYEPFFSHEAMYMKTEAIEDTDVVQGPSPDLQQEKQQAKEYLLKIIDGLTTLEEIEELRTLLLPLKNHINQCA